MSTPFLVLLELFALRDMRIPSKFSYGLFICFVGDWRGRSTVFPDGPESPWHAEAPWFSLSNVPFPPPLFLSFLRSGARRLRVPFSATIITSGSPPSLSLDLLPSLGLFLFFAVPVMSLRALPICIHVFFLVYEVISLPSSCPRGRSVSSPFPLLPSSALNQVPSP